MASQCDSCNTKGDCESLQRRCEDIADWLKKKGMSKLTSEDTEILDFLLSKMTGDTFILTFSNLQNVVGCAFLAGCKRAYEIHQLEAIIR